MGNRKEVEEEGIGNGWDGTTYSYVVSKHGFSHNNQLVSILNDDLLPLGSGSILVSTFEYSIVLSPSPLSSVSRGRGSGEREGRWEFSH